MVLDALDSVDSVDLPDRLRHRVRNELLPRIVVKHPPPDFGSTKSIAFDRFESPNREASLRTDTIDDRIVREDDVEGWTDRLDVGRPDGVPIDVLDWHDEDGRFDAFECAIDHRDPFTRREGVSAGVGGLCAPHPDDNLLRLLADPLDQPPMALVKRLKPTGEQTSHGIQWAGNCPKPRD